MQNRRNPVFEAVHSPRVRPSASRWKGLRSWFGLPLGLAMALVACGTSDELRDTDDGSGTFDAGESLLDGSLPENPAEVDASTPPAQNPDGQADSGAPTLKAACLDRPSAIERPPGTGLPCELLPPGMRL